MTAPYSPAGAAEFPNDNPELHRGARWVCLAPRGPARAVLRPSASPVSVAPPAPVSAPLGAAAPIQPWLPAPPDPAPAPASVRRYEGPLELDLHRLVTGHRVENVPPPPDFIFTPFVSSRAAEPRVAEPRAAEPRAAEPAPISERLAIDPRRCQVIDEREACRRIDRGRRVDVAPCLDIGALDSPRRPSRRRIEVMSRLPPPEEVAGELALEAASA